MPTLPNVPIAGLPTELFVPLDARLEGACVGAGPLRALALCGLLVLAPIAHAQVLHRGNGPEPSTLDAHRCQEIACANILRDLYEGLVADGPDGRPIPGMAERWDTSADGRTWTFHLREGLHWSDGSTLDAAQVVASFRRAFAPATAAPLASHFSALRNALPVQRGDLPPEALGVAAPDPRTVVFTLERSAAMEQLLTLPIAFPVDLRGVATHGAEHTRPGRLVGNGAYRLQAWRPQAQITLVRNPHFREGAPIPEVRFHVTEDAASELQRFAAGGLHITETLPPQPLDGLRARFGGQLRIAPYLGSFWLGLNLTRPPLGGCADGDADCAARRRALREALSLAVDRDILVRHVTGFGEAPAHGLVPPGVAGYVPATLPWAGLAREPRLALARQRLADAGYGPDRPLQIELRYNTSTPHRRMALAVASMWREHLGVRVRLRNEEWRVYVRNRRQRAITEVFRGGWIADVDDARNFLALFQGGTDNVLNWSGFDDPAFDALIDAADSAPDAATRAVHLKAAERRLLAAHAIVPLYFYTSKHLVHADVDGWVDNPLDRHPSRFLRLREGG